MKSLMHNTIGETKKYLNTGISTQEEMFQNGLSPGSGQRQLLWRGRSQGGGGIGEIIPKPGMPLLERKKRIP